MSPRSRSATKRTTIRYLLSLIVKEPWRDTEEQMAAVMYALAEAYAGEPGGKPPSLLTLRLQNSLSFKSMFIAAVSLLFLTLYTVQLKRAC